MSALGHLQPASSLSLEGLLPGGLEPPRPDRHFSGQNQPLGGVYEQPQIFTGI